MNLSGKTAVVTGGSRGIGRAVCLELARSGANVVLCCLKDETAANKTAAACETVGGPAALALRCDVRDAAAVSRLMETAYQTFGSVDILVNSAGVLRYAPLSSMKLEDFSSVVDTELMGSFLCAQAASAYMLRGGWGRIVNLSGTAGFRGGLEQSNHAAGKAGVIGLTQALARELAPGGITVNSVAPGFIETDMTAALPKTHRDAALSAIPMVRTGSAEEAARAVLFFIDPDNGYITGQTLAVDGGLSL